MSPPGKDDKTAEGKRADAEAVSEPVLKPELKAAAKPKTKGADGRKEAAEARREAAQKVLAPENAACSAAGAVPALALPSMLLLERAASLPTYITISHRANI